MSMPPLALLPPPDRAAPADPERKRRAPADAGPAAAEGYVFARIVLADEDSPEVDNLS
jgi:hypothetical protein